MAVTRIPYTGKDMRKETVCPIVLVYLVGVIEKAPHLLLMRRGSHVAYMPNAWSIIAGYINSDLPPWHQALIEIGSETGLLESHVTPPDLIERFSDVDSGNGKTWVRHLMISHVLPHVCSLDENLGVRLDWEHTECAWVPVATILDWLRGGVLTDPTEVEILCREEHTPDFRLNLERMAVEFWRVLERYAI